jgi:hypothetical protein
MKKTQTKKPTQNEGEQKNVDSSSLIQHIRKSIKEDHSSFSIEKFEHVILLLTSPDSRAMSVVHLNQMVQYIADQPSSECSESYYSTESHVSRNTRGSKKINHA